ncbi:MAG: hypothetical protein JSS72_01415 [Armatimonadetes bacterium]|nr:hypothetical protein [Armatimonadota bacterium]
MQISIVRTSLAIVGALSLAVATRAIVPANAQSGKAKAIDYAQVNLVLRNNYCNDCHVMSAGAMGGLHLGTREGMLKGGHSGPAAVPGNADASLIIKALTGAEGVRKMPPQGGSMKPEDIEVIREWINQGAKPSVCSQALSDFYTAAFAQKWDDAWAACQKIASQKIDGVRTDFLAARLSLSVLLHRNDEENFYKEAAIAVKIRPVNAGLFDTIASGIVNPESKFKHRDTKLALQAAELAVKDSDRKSGAILNTLAWAYYWRGDRAKAIQTANEALKCHDAVGGTKDEINASLKKFGG